MKKLIKRTKTQTGTVSAYNTTCDRYCPCFNCLTAKNLAAGAKQNISAANIAADKRSKGK